MYQMDDSIGKIMDKLESLQIDNNTLVIFVSDNGAWPDAKEPFTVTGFFSFLFFFILFSIYSINILIRGRSCWWK